MKVILIIVSSVNGKTTRGSDPDIYKWTSQEDQEFFFRFLKTNNLAVMGSKTYEAARDKIKPEKEKLRVVLTRNPEKYAQEAIPNQIEFSSESPTELVKRLEKEGYEIMHLVSGATVNKLFLEEGLVNEIYVTLEPRLFGKGNPFSLDGDFSADLKLLDYKKLNDSGTLLLHYKVT